MKLTPVFVINPGPLSTLPFIVLLLLLATTIPGSLVAQDIAQVKKGVVKITAQVEGKNRIGSGVVVKVEEDHVYIVTASHVIEGDQHPSVFFFSAPHRPFRARVLGLEGGDSAGTATLVSVSSRTFPNPLPFVLLPFASDAMELPGP